MQELSPSTRYPEYVFADIPSAPNAVYPRVKLGSGESHMCGICGVIQKHGLIDYTTLASMTDCMAHRGPDDVDSMVFETGQQGPVRQEQGNVGLGHRRLAIIDLSPLGRQPMSYRSHTIVFNGEIYNYQALRRQLESRGHQFRSESDTEVLLAAYDEWQMDLLSLVNGMFAFVIWDANRQQMLVARDRIGIKPVYYYAKDSIFIATSELKSILKHPAVTPELDHRSLSEYVNRGYIGSPWTVFKHIYKLEPGHYLRVQAGDIIENICYWQVTDCFGREHDTDLMSAAEQLNNLLRDAVQLRMISDVPLGALLSGGVDSSLVVAMMQQQSTQRIKTFTVAFNEAQFQEAHHARAIAEYLGTDHTELLLDERELINFVPELVTYFDEPFADNSAIPTRAIFRAAREQVTVSLTGDGGDELFLGYPTYRWITMRERLRDSTPAFVAQSLSRAGAKLPIRRVSRFAKLIGFETAFEAHRWVTANWTPDECIHLMTDWRMHAENSYDITVRKLQQRHLLHRLSAADMGSYMVDDILTKTDRASMSVSLEARVPLLDHRVIEFAAGLPVAYKYNRGNAKRLLRELAYHYVPRPLLDRPKKGFSAPIHSWLRGPLYELMQSKLSRNELNRHGLFNTAYVHKIWRGYLEDNQPYSQKLWNLLVFQLWYEHYMM